MKLRAHQGQEQDSEIVLEKGRGSRPQASHPVDDEQEDSGHCKVHGQVLHRDIAKQVSSIIESTSGLAPPD